MKNMLWTAVAKLFLVGSKESENNKTASWVLSSFAKCLQGVFSEDFKKWHVWRTQLENAPLRDNELSTSSTQRRRLFFNAYWNDLQTSQPLHIVYLLIPEVLFSNIIHNKKDLGRDKSLTWHQKNLISKAKNAFPKASFPPPTVSTHAVLHAIFQGRQLEVTCQRQHVSIGSLPGFINC